MSTISVSNLKKTYLVHQKNPGITGTLSSFFSRKYREVKAINNISFSIKKGELVGFIGPNGAGKTTTLKCLSGLILPNSGELNVLGFNPFDKKRDFLHQIALVMGQKNQLFWDLPAIETFLLLKEIYAIKDSVYEKNLNELVVLLDASHVLNTPVRKLSLGERMKCELIAALIHKPRILFLDEPTIGLDVVMQKAMREFIKAYNRRFEATIILSSHYMDDIKQLCDRVIVIDLGTIRYDGKLERLVKRFAKNKIISVVFETYVDPKKINGIGNLVSYNHPKAVISVKRESVKSAATHILKNFPISDIEIGELEIEDIIRNVFSGKTE